MIPMKSTQILDYQTRKVPLLLLLDLHDVLLYANGK